MLSKMPSEIKEFIQDWNNQVFVVSSIIGFLAYLLYVRKFRHYIYLQEDDIKEEGQRPRGKCPPYFPNGWYRVLNSNELSVNQVKYLDYCGRNIAIFRGSNGKVYALHAFCAHMGANLGIGGTVRHQTCIQCPFHGWTFNGETGECVVTGDDKLIRKHVETFEYNDIKRIVKKDNQYLSKCSEGNAKLKTYEVKEINGCIFVWLESREHLQNKYPYEPLPIKIPPGLSYRGESINFVNCHMQEIPENGADIRHFDFLHTTFVAFIRFEWTMLSHRASAPDLFEVMRHKRPFINEFKTSILKRYITETNKNHLNVISLDCYMKIFGFKFFFFNATGFQVGPALVYLFLKSWFFELIFEQAVIPLKKFKQRVSHKVHANWYLPYWLSAFMLYSEVQQVLSDMNIWNKKVFGDRLNYNLKTEADKNLLSWRNWYAQFYEGCHEFEKSSNINDW